MYLCFVGFGLVFQLFVCCIFEVFAVRVLEVFVDVYGGWCVQVVDDFVFDGGVGRVEVVLDFGLFGLYFDVDDVYEYYDDRQRIVDVQFLFARCFAVGFYQRVVFVEFLVGVYLFG